MLDLHRLRLLRELKHRGTLAAVAEALAYSPSSISQQLSVLEREAGVRLLEPVGRRVRLTPQAEPRPFWSAWNVPRRTWPRPWTRSPACCGSPCSRRPRSRCCRAR
ncbi:helix-turn-helix domain-containing protein [Actinomadura atramentaria]|uniref:helix-turn-helix domain-containing protein n=1 Tax=Actinomadura atramentaria TaxID=1990 RepID=UPI001969C2C2|nr:LysR family transcriptional regulator [Actinomadura atramentaria]